MFPALSVEQLSVTYDRFPVLWDVSFELPQGKIAAVIGPNGAGKSSLIKAVMGLIPTISGRVRFFNKPLSCQRVKVAYVPQRESVDWEFPITVFDLVLMGRYHKLGIFQSPRDADKAAAERALEIVQMQAFANHQINELSGGQQQRVFLARALVQEADLYILDEPFAGIDLATEKHLMQLMKALAQEGKTFLIVHHDLGTVTEYFDWVVLVNMGLVVAGSVESCFKKEFLEKTYGKSFGLIQQLARLAEEKHVSIVSQG